MTTPAPQQPARPVVAAHTLGWWLLVVSAVLFVIAAFAAAGEPLGDIPAWTWGFAGFAAWVLSGAVP